MAKPEWGAKRICHNCGARYYDLQRDPIICPKCGTEFDPEAFLKSRRSRSAIIDEPPVKVRVRAEEGSDALLAEETEEDEAAEEIVEEVEVIDQGDIDETSTEEDEAAVPVKEKGPGADEFDEEEDLVEEGDVLIEDADDLGEEDVDVEIEDEGEERNR